MLESLVNKGFLIALIEPDTYDISPQGKIAVGIEDKPTPATKGKVRTGTKLHAVIELLARPEGAAIAEIMDRTGWQKRTVRGTLAGTLKKKAGTDH